MNPLDLTGPAFLVLWLGGVVGIAALTWGVRAAVASRGPRTEPARCLERLDATEIAFALGGIERAIEAAVVGLHHRGLVELDDRGTLRAVARATAPVVRAEGVFRGVAADEPRSRVDAYVLNALPARLSTLLYNADHVERVLQRKLEEAGLLVPDRVRATWLVRVPGLVWLAFGIAKIGVGIARDRPVFALCMLVLLGGWVLTFVRAPRMTAAGARLKRFLEREHAALSTTAIAAPEQLDAHDLTLAYGVFGSMVAPSALAVALPSYQPPVPVTSASSCGSATSCGGGGGGDGGGGDGGGGGGGCGGCSS